MLSDWVPSYNFNTNLNVLTPLRTQISLVIDNLSTKQLVAPIQGQHGSLRKGQPHLVKFHRAMSVTTSKVLTT